MYITINIKRYQKEKTSITENSRESKEIPTQQTKKQIVEVAHKEKYRNKLTWIFLFRQKKINLHGLKQKFAQDLLQQKIPSAPKVMYSCHLL